MLESRYRVVAILPREVKIVQGAGHQDVCIGVKSFRELASLVAQVALHLEFHIVFIALVQAA